MSDDNIIDLQAKRESRSGPPPSPPVEANAKPGKFELHLYSMEEDNHPAEVVTSEGYLKFGPQFIAIVDGAANESNVILAVATPSVKYVKRIEDEKIQATLAL